VYQKITVAGSNVIINDDNKASFFDMAAQCGCRLPVSFHDRRSKVLLGLIDVKNDWFNRYAQLGLKVSF
jgi:hypothetical protein